MRVTLGYRAFILSGNNTASGLTACALGMILHRVYTDLKVGVCP